MGTALFHWRIATTKVDLFDWVTLLVRDKTTQLRYSGIYRIELDNRPFDNYFRLPQSRAHTNDLLSALQRVAIRQLTQQPPVLPQQPPELFPSELQSDTDPNADRKQRKRRRTIMVESCCYSIVISFVS